MNLLLFSGILLRFLVFRTAGPFNPDQHYQVIQYIAAHHRLPLSNELEQSYHPPLYHLLMAPLEKACRDPKALQFVSFVFSSINLILIKRLLENTAVFQLTGNCHPEGTPEGSGTEVKGQMLREYAQDDRPSDVGGALRMFLFAFACFLPQYVMFGNFVSNDTLTILLGTILMMAIVSYLLRPTLLRCLTVALVIALGMLTKGTFLLTGPAVAILVLIFEFRRGGGRWQTALIRTAVFCLFWTVLGSYKYVENYLHFGRPIVHNMDFLTDFATSQRGTWKGWQTVYDINVLKLIREPILKVHNTFSYPLLLYGTFWYPHYPDSSYRGNVNGYQWLGSIIYALAVVPTIFFVIGLSQGIRITIPRREPADVSQLVVVASVLLLLSNLGVVIAAGLKYDTWSSFQARLCFQSMPPMLLLFGVGMESVRWSRPVFWICWLLVACFVLYFLIEFGLYSGVLMPGTSVEP